MLLVADGPEQEANLNASYIAQRNQRGTGTTTERLRPSLPEPSLGIATENGQASGDLQATTQARRQAIPAARFGKAEEFGAYCAFLCSVHSGYITGQNLLIDGGAYPGTF